MYVDRVIEQIPVSLHHPLTSILLQSTPRCDFSQSIPHELLLDPNFAEALLMKPEK
jgi:hypothetical protein